MFGISVPLPIINANRAGIAQARAQREVARARAETTFAQLDRSLDATLQAVHLTEQQRTAFEARIVPLLDDQMHDLQRVAELGEIDLFVMLETTTRQLDARMRLLTLHVAHVQATTLATELLGPEQPIPPAPVIVDVPNARQSEPQPSLQGGA
jgi:cobalt-zinc-cadmium efflux system outer membrane protein